MRAHFASRKSADNKGIDNPARRTLNAAAFGGLAPPLERLVAVPTHAVAAEIAQAKVVGGLRLGLRGLLERGDAWIVPVLRIVPFLIGNLIFRAT